MLYSEFHTISQTSSCNFKQFSCTFMQFWLFSHFGVTFNIFGINMPVLKLRNSMVMFSRMFMHSLMQFHTIFTQLTQFLLFQPFLGQFQHVGYQKACTRAEKFNDDIFTHFHALPHAISRNFHTMFTRFHTTQVFPGIFQHKYCTNSKAWSYYGQNIAQNVIQLVHIG